MVNPMDMDRDTDAGSDLVSRRAELFRSKLISHFRLLDKYTEDGYQKDRGVLFTPNDILDEKKVQTILAKSPEGLVGFESPNNRPEMSGDRRTNRLATKASKYPPPYLWAHWIVESLRFQIFILVLLVLNGLALGVQGALETVVEPWVDKVKLAIDVFDLLCLFIYIVEILLKCLDDFSGFWKSGWNIFDFIITFTFLIPEILIWSSGEYGDINPQSREATLGAGFRAFRILKLLKIIPRAQRIRLISMAVTKALHYLLFIAVLLLAVAFVFAIIGVTFFRDGYNREDVTALNYPKSFSGLGATLITLFQLFTFDHFLDVYSDMRRVGSAAFSITYVITWILLGALIFTSIFVGIMVNNFQTIRSELFREVQAAREKREQEKRVREVGLDLERKRLEEVREKERAETGNRSPAPPEDGSGAPGARNTRQEVSDWARTVEQHLAVMRLEDSSFLWPSDTLFRYFRVMETLMENLKERGEVTRALNQIILQVQDN